VAFKVILPIAKLFSVVSRTVVTVDDFAD